MCLLQNVCITDIIYKDRVLDSLSFWENKQIKNLRFYIIKIICV